jgi:hypothetical protein
MTTLAAGPVTGMAGNGGPGKAHQGTVGGTTFGAPTPTAPTKGPGSTPAKAERPAPDAGSGQTGR